MYRWMRISISNTSEDGSFDNRYVLSSFGPLDAFELSRTGDKCVGELNVVLWSVAATGLKWPRSHFSHLRPHRNGCMGGKICYTCIHPFRLYVHVAYTRLCTLLLLAAAALWLYCWMGIETLFMVPLRKGYRGPETRRAAGDQGYRGTELVWLMTTTTRSRISLATCLTGFRSVQARIETFRPKNRQRFKSTVQKMAKLLRKVSWKFGIVFIPRNIVEFQLLKRLRFRSFRCGTHAAYRFVWRPVFPTV